MTKPRHVRDVMANRHLESETLKPRYVRDRIITLRIITQSCYDEPSMPLFMKMNILPYDKVHELKIATCVFNVVKNNLPFHVSLFCTSSRVTRNQTYGNFNLPPTKNTYGQRLLQFSGPKIWNKLPAEIKQSNNFSSVLKKYLLTQNNVYQ